MTRRSLWLSVAVVALCGAGGALALHFGGGAGQGTPPAPAPQPTAAAAETPTPAPVAAVVPPPAPPPEAPARPMARYPDGTEMPLLNGVQEAVGMNWSGEFSPVAEKVTDQNGIQWYRHRDGSWSTTLMLMDEAKGERVGASLVYQSGGPPRPTRFKGPPPPVSDR